MTTKTHLARWIAPITIALSLPVVLAYAQEVGSDASTTPEVVETTPEVTVSDATSTDPVDVQAGEVMGTSTEATSSEPTAEEQPPAQNSGGGSSESSDPAPEPAPETPAPEASTTEDVSSSTLEAMPPTPIDVASTTASSTDIIVPPRPQPVDLRTVFIQTGTDVRPHYKAGETINVTITLQNLSCRFDCKTMSPAATVNVYVTPWYPNDANVVVPTDKIALQTLSVLPMAGWATSTVKWSGQVSTPGKYIFTVVVDPDNAIGARDMYRAEFSVE